MDPTILRIDIVGPILKNRTEIKYILTINFCGTPDSYEFDTREEAEEIALRIRNDLKAMRDIE